MKRGCPGLGASVLTGVGGHLAWGRGRPASEYLLTSGALGCCWFRGVDGGTAGRVHRRVGLRIYAGGPCVPRLWAGKGGEGAARQVGTELYGASAANVELARGGPGDAPAERRRYPGPPCRR